MNATRSSLLSGKAAAVLLNASAKAALMKITLTDAGKRFNRDWIFRHLSYEFSSQHHYAITGPNGSGKSTLLQVIAGAIGISEGLVSYEQVPSSATLSSAASIAPEKAYHYLSLSAPFLELIEEMTAMEFLQFHHSFTPFLSSHPIPNILSTVGLE